MGIAWTEGSACFPFDLTPGYDEIVARAHEASGLPLWAFLEPIIFATPAPLVVTERSMTDLAAITLQHRVRQEGYVATAAERRRATRILENAHRRTATRLRSLRARVS